MKKIYRTTGITLLFLIISILSNAQITKLTDLVSEPINDKNGGDGFGHSIAMTDDIIVVGVFQNDYDENNDNELSNAGAAFVFYRNKGGSDNWGFVKKLVPTGKNARNMSDFFGKSVSISDDIIVVGAPRHYYNEVGEDPISFSGAAFVFYKNEGGTDNWGLKKKLVANGPRSRNHFDEFGCSVAIYNNIITIGAQQHDFDLNGDDSILNAGAAYIFYRNKGGADNWGQIKKITGVGKNGRSTNGFFGSSVAISNTILVVGAHGYIYDEKGENEKLGAGAAFIFYKDEGGNDSWGLKKVLVGKGINGRNKHDKFGSALSINHNIIVVGSTGQDFNSIGSDSIENSGAAFIFYKDEGGIDNWGVKKKITAGSNRKNANDGFGVSVSVSKDLIAVGAWQYDFFDDSFPLKDQGAVFTFSRNVGGEDNWGLSEKLFASGDHSKGHKDGFGKSIVLSNNIMAVGIPNQNFYLQGSNPIISAGKVSVFRIGFPTSIDKQKNVEPIKVAGENKNIHITISKNGNYAITILDLMGRKLLHTQSKGNTTKIVSLPYVTTGYYIVKISSGNTQQVFKTYLQ